MHRLHRLIPAVICAGALMFSGNVASANQGKGKDQAKHHEQVKAKETKEQDHDRRPVATSGAEMRFRGLDKDHDGRITRAEWKGSDRSFANQDWNHDGILSGDEVRPGATRPGTSEVRRGGHDPDEALFARLDVNHDGRLSRAEFNGGTDVFNRIDFNHDGVLTPYEFGDGR